MKLDLQKQFLLAMAFIVTAGLVIAQVGGTFDATDSGLNSGSGTSTGGTYSLDSSAGSVFVSSTSSTGGTYELQSGALTVEPTAPPAGVGDWMVLDE